MDSLSRVGCLAAYRTAQLPRTPATSRCRSASLRRSDPLVSVSRAVPPSVSDADEDVLQIFFKERELNGDFISRASDLLWQRKFRNSVDSGSSKLTNTSQEQTSDGNDGFLKLSRTHEWILGENTSPMNRKAVAKALQDSTERWKKLSILKYESAAVSYAIGVLFSCLYFQLLYQHADNLSSATVPQIFMEKKSKKIGIRSEDLQDLLERSIKGTSISLSSPMLVIPAAIFGLWVLSHQYFTNDIFDFQANLGNVYRDNEDLQFVFPEKKEGSSA